MNIKNMGLYLAMGALSAGLFFSGCESYDEVEDRINERGDYAKAGMSNYLDAGAVAGVSYSCGKYSGTTNGSGGFEFEQGKGCTFSYSKLKIKEVEAYELVNGVALREGNIITSMALQSLDKDMNPSNGIQISGAQASLLLDAGVVKLPETDTELAEFLEIAESIKLHVPSAKDACAYLQKNNPDMVCNLDRFDTLGKPKTETTQEEAPATNSGGCPNSTSTCGQKTPEQTQTTGADAIIQAEVEKAKAEAEKAKAEAEKAKAEAEKAKAEAEKAKAETTSV